MGEKEIRSDTHKLLMFKLVCEPDGEIYMEFQNGKRHDRKSFSEFDKEVFEFAGKHLWEII